MTYTSIARRALVALALLTFALAVCAPAVPAGQTSSQIPSGQEVARELPPPDPSKAATRFAKVVGWPKGTMPQPAQGFSVALFADGPSRIGGLGSLRHKESDRLAAISTEMSRLGADVEVVGDALVVRPGRLHGAEIDPHGDHRIAMSMAIAGTVVEGVTIRDPQVVNKTWPGFWDFLESVAAG